MDVSLAMRSMVPEHDGMVVACSGTSAAMLAKWHEELRALRPNKRVRWHAKLWDKWRVAQRVRYVGEVRYVGYGDEQLPYEFEVWAASASAASRADSERRGPDRKHVMLKCSVLWRAEAKVATAGGSVRKCNTSRGSSERSC